jgi:lysozyme family protein
MDFDDSFLALIGNEGRYSNDPRDPGGETMFGISKRSYPQEDIANLSLDRAKFLYRRDYWGPAGCDAVPDPIKFHLFDTAVNQGVRTAIRVVQNAVGETPDGILGPRTLQAIASMDATKTVLRFSGARLIAYTSTAGWEDFGKGWVNRVAGNLMRS